MQAWCQWWSQSSHVPSGWQTPWHSNTKFNGFFGQKNAIHFPPQWEYPFTNNHKGFSNRFWHSSTCPNHFFSTPGLVGHRVAFLRRGVTLRVRRDDVAGRQHLAGGEPLALGMVQIAWPFHGETAESFTSRSDMKWFHWLSGLALASSHPWFFLISKVFKPVQAVSFVPYSERFKIARNKLNGNKIKAKTNWSVFNGVADSLCLLNSPPNLLPGAVGRVWHLRGVRHHGHGTNRLGSGHHVGRGGVDHWGACRRHCRHLSSLSSRRQGLQSTGFDTWRGVGSFRTWNGSKCDVSTKTAPKCWSRRGRPSLTLQLTNPLQ